MSFQYPGELIPEKRLLCLPLSRHSQAQNLATYDRPCTLDQRFHRLSRLLFCPSPTRIPRHRVVRPIPIEGWLLFNQFWW